MAKKERLDKILANMGYGSRKDVKKLIKEGRVEVNNKIEKKNDLRINPYNTLIKIDGEKIFYRKYIYLMMNKPKDVVSSTDDPVNRTVLDLLEEEHLIFNPFPAGRLDKDTEGLLLLTNDGKLAHELLSPKKGVNKTYYAEVDGFVEESYIDRFKEGIILDDGYKTLPSKLEILESSAFSKVKLTIKEGKFHQVKRMFEAFNMEVVYLKRISMGGLELDKNLSLGEYRELTEKEIQLLKENN
ncbi:MAG: rRNA pseudouridine synthase [Tissierellia bacterium]|nr:rRNA pseudouridine synthase [Tissierellia bacterium]